MRSKSGTTPCADSVRFKKGCVRRDRETPPQYRGPCCGGTREVGLGKKAKCDCCGKYEMYVCQTAGRSLSRTSSASAPARSKCPRSLRVPPDGSRLPSWPQAETPPQGRRWAAAAAAAAARWCLAELANHPTASFDHTGALTRTWTMRLPRRCLRRVCSSRPSVRAALPRPARRCDAHHIVVMRLELRLGDAARYDETRRDAARHAPALCTHLKV